MDSKRGSVSRSPRGRSVYACQDCGGQTPQWAGQCPECGAWNTLVESLPPVGSDRTSWSEEAGTGVIHRADAVEAAAAMVVSTGIAELDRVLGGGLVPGAVVLLGGDPGIGKSTLLLQVLARIAQSGRVSPLYVTAEESLAQVAQRARRLIVAVDGLRLLTETRVETIASLAAAARPGTLVVDSIQAVYAQALPSAPGSVAQVRECGAQLVRFAKDTATTVLLVGHVTKDGALAGPRILEHMVDTVLYFESESNQRYRVIRAVKNRFGAANELGVFAMTETGLREVASPSAIFLSRHAGPVAGSVVTVTREGTRALLLELQALVDDSALASPRRVSVGVDANRLAMLLAVLHRHAGVSAHGQDVFLNVVGGVRVTETGADLPILAAVLSSLRDKPVPRDLVLFGEVGLAGEIRPVYNGEERLRAAAQHGFARAIVPSANRPSGPIDGLEVHPVSRLPDALALL